MITKRDVISIGTLRRTQTQNLPPFVFVERDGLLVPYRSGDVGELIGNEVFVLRSDIRQDDEDVFTWQDLVGYTVMDEEENGEWTRIGVIGSVDESTINTLATLEDGRMMPLHEDFMVDIDEDEHVLRVHLPFAL